MCLTKIIRILILSKTEILIFLIFPFVSEMVFSEHLIDYSKCEIKMSLTKKTYKTYEPVIAVFEVINHDTAVMEIHDQFDIYSTSGPNIKITNVGGDQWGYNKLKGDFEILYPEGGMYAINPNETLYVSMSINNFAVSVSGKDLRDNNNYFAQDGFFPPGKYKVYYYFYVDMYNDLYGKFVKSNEVAFKVTENSEEDDELLGRYKKIYGSVEEYEELLNDYPDNSFTEHVMAEFLTWKHNKLDSLEHYKYSADLKSDYSQFMSKYPDSPYLLKSDFVSAFIYQIIIGSSTVEDAITKVKKITTNKLFIRSLNKQFVKNNLGYRAHY